MNLIIATGIYPPDIGGPATYSKKIAEEFSKRGWKVSVLTYADELKPPLSPFNKGGNFKVVGISRKHNVFVRYFLYTKRLVKLAKRADLVYVQGPVSEGLPAYLASKLTGKKYVLKIVGDYAWESYSRNEEKQFIDLAKFQNIKGLSFKVKILKFIERLVAKNASKIIVPSNYLKGIVEKWGISGDKIRVIYNAVCDANIQMHTNNTNNTNKESIILSVGRLVPWKGFDVLIDLMPELLEINQNFKLIIAGGGPDYENLKNRIKNDKIVLTGKIEQEELFQYMSIAKMFVLNSGYEGLPHIVIEAIQHDLPVAVSNIGGNPELVENGKTGLLFEYNNKEEIKNAIIKLSQDKNLSNDLAQNAKNKIKEFSFDRMVEETAEILERHIY